MQVDACLKEREVYDFTTADFEQDRETLRSFERERLSTELALDMVVVADTSPINYLVLISRIDLPASLYTRMLIPPAVLAELKHPVAPKIVRDWAYSAPVWLEVLSPMRDLTLP